MEPKTNKRKKSLTAIPATTKKDKGKNGKKKLKFKLKNKDKDERKGKWHEDYEYCLECKKVDTVHFRSGYCKPCLQSQNWSEDYWLCKKCFSFKTPHVIDGYCQACMDKMELPEELNKDKKKSRFCLKCDEKFESKGPENRRCEKCRRKETIMGKTNPLKISLWTH